MPDIIDLFSGAGGLTLGFTQVRDIDNQQIFNPVFANDNNNDACDTYNLNFGNHCTSNDIHDIVYGNPELLPNADLVIGGPPCQGFSLLNKNRVGDPRRDMWRPFLDTVLLSNANHFVIENVPGLLKSQEFSQLSRFATQHGFNIESKVLCAANYGVPQVRHRAIVIGSRLFNPLHAFPDPTHSLNSGNATDEWRTVRDAIEDLPPPIGTEIRDETPPFNLHFGRNPTQMSIQRYRAIPKEGMNRFDLQRNAPHLTPACWKNKPTGSTDIFGRLWWDKPSLTIRTEFFKPEKGRYLHPVQHRPITHREAARLQTFPDDFVFCGSKIEVARQIGNAVPPLLAVRIAESLATLLGYDIVPFEITDHQNEMA